VTNCHYDFQSVWDLDAPLATVWAALSQTPFSWDQWWPQLTDVQNMQLQPGLSGSTFSCYWRAPIGYKLKSDIAIGTIKPLKSVQLYSRGDLSGTVTCRLSNRGGRTHIAIDWQVQTTKNWMNALVPILRPVFIQSHHAVMKSGERGLQKICR